MSAFFSGGVRFGLCIFGLLVLLLFPEAARAERLPEFLKTIPPSEIFPNADRYGEPEGKPMAARVYKGQEQLGLVYITTDVVNTRGYSSKPIDTMVALADDGTIVGARLVAHNEPIVLIGIPQSKIDKFIQDYVGLNLVKSPLKPGSMPSDIVSGATVTLMVINDSIQRSVKTVAAAYKLGTPQESEAVRTASAETQGAASQTAQTAPQAAATRPRRAVNPDKQDVLSWEELLAQKAVAKLHLTVDEANKLFEGGGKTAAAQHPEPGPGDAVFVDLYVALASQPAVGKSLLGEAGWNALQSRLKPKQSALVVAGEGRYSWKGSGYVRGGIFDRIKIIQGDTSFRFTDAQHERLTALEAAGAPQFKEVSLFTVPDDVDFDGAEPWRTQLVIQRATGVHDKAFVFSERLKVNGNIAVNSTNQGLMLNYANHSEIRGNVIDKADKCVFVYNANYNRLIGNRFESCAIGIHFTAAAEGNTIHDNAFVNNQNQIKYVSTRHVDWAEGGRGNYWSDNSAFDLDGDGFGDHAYRPNGIIDQIVWRAPAARLLMNSPAVSIVKWAQSQFPAILPGGVTDSKPLMVPPENKTFERYRTMRGKHDKRHRSMPFSKIFSDGLPQGSLKTPAHTRSSNERSARCFKRSQQTVRRPLCRKKR